MDNTETGRVVDDLIGNAKNNFEYRQLLKDYEEALRKLDDPMLIQEKAEALNVCNTIIEWSVEKGAIPSGSVLHRLGLRLMDYLTRSVPLIPSDEKSDKSLALLQRLSGDMSVWSGTIGFNNIRIMNRALRNTSNKMGPSEASLPYRALRNLTNGQTETQFRELMGDDFTVFTNTYIDTMILMEAGIRPQVITAIINEVVKQKPVNSYAQHFEEIFNLPHDAAESLAKIAGTINGDCNG